MYFVTGWLPHVINKVSGTKIENKASQTYSCVLAQVKFCNFVIFVLHHIFTYANCLLWSIPAMVTYLLSMPPSYILHVFALIWLASYQISLYSISAFHSLYVLSVAFKFYHNANPFISNTSYSLYIALYFLLSHIILLYNQPSIVWSIEEGRAASKSPH